MKIYRNEKYEQNVKARASLSAGTSCEPVYREIASCLRSRHPGGGTLVDIGCGTGMLWSYIRELFEKYVGVDVVKYGSLPDEIEFHELDLDTGESPLPDGYGDVVIAAETIEHLENPRSFARELDRLVKPGGWVVITTPNQLSLLSKLTLILKNQFNAFQAGSYPAHLTALLEDDLRRIGGECGWTNIAIAYSGSGRIPGVYWHWPRALSRIFPRTLSDNILLVGQKPGTKLPPSHSPGG